MNASKSRGFHVTYKVWHLMLIWVLCFKIALDNWGRLSSVLHIIQSWIWYQFSENYFIHSNAKQVVEWMPLTNYFCGVFCWLAEVCSKLLRFPIFLWVEIAITWVFLFCLGWHFWAPFFEKKKVFHERFYESTHWLRRILKRKFSTFFQSDTMVKDSVKFLVDAMMKQDDSIDSIASKDASNQKDVEEVTLKDSNLQEKVPPPLCLC